MIVLMIALHDLGVGARRLVRPPGKRMEFKYAVPDRSIMGLYFTSRHKYGLHSGYDTLAESAES